MFGKCIYFTNVASKAANYSFKDNNEIELLLLCDVALGQMRKAKSANFITDIPNACEKSVKGCGNYVPTQYEKINKKLPIACGKIRKRNFDTSHDYNEYLRRRTGENQVLIQSETSS